jgi:pimeloyl-ACP methyl ester carboxylesterase
LGYEVIAPDLRSHGTSPSGGRMRLEDYADDVLALGDDWDFVLGHSLGGSVVLVVMDSRPAWARRLVLEDPAIVGRADPEIMGWLLEEFEEPITAERVAGSNPLWHPKDAEFKAEALQQCGPDVVHRTMGEAPWNVWEAMVGLSVPTLLLGADPTRGALVQPEIGAAAAGVNPLIRFETIADADHSIHRNEYGAFWALVGEFAAG